MTNQELAAEHARQAAEALAEAKKRTDTRRLTPAMAGFASIATAHATLAIYFQNEA
jgi:hypothetical protein